MLPISKSIEQGWGGGGLYDILRQLQNMAVPITQGMVYYVWKGGNNVDGLSWETAYTTIEAAITEQRRWRATQVSALQSVNCYIFIAAGTYDENITSFPMSTTLVGLGVRGTDKATEWNTTSGACMAGTVSGMRLINIRFEAGGAFDLLDFNICNNVEILNCDFQCKDNDNVAAISTENSGNLTIRNCRIGTNGITTFEYGIYAAGGANKYFQNAVIENNVIEGLDATGTGIFIHGNASNDFTIIKNNIIKLTGAGTGISVGATGSAYKQSMVIGNYVFHVSGTALDVNDAFAAMNILSNNGTVTVHPTLSLTSGN